jgi:hypothetical protein
MQVNGAQEYGEDGCRCANHRAPDTEMLMREFLPDSAIRQSTVWNIVGQSEDKMTKSIRYRGFWILAWFVALLIYNVASHWSQNGDKNALFIYLQALGQLTSPLELVLSVAIVYGILSNGKRKSAEESENSKKTFISNSVVRTALILGGVLASVIVVGVVVAYWPGGRTAYKSGQSKSQTGNPADNPNALSSYAITSRSDADLGTEEDGLSPETKKMMRENLTLEMSGLFQKLNSPIRVDVVGANHDVLVFQLASMNSESANELIQGFRQENDANFWNAMRLMRYSQVIFTGDSFKRVVEREEFLNFGKDYEQYKAAFLKASKSLKAGAQGEVKKP